MVRLPWRRADRAAPPSRAVTSLLHGSALFDEGWVSRQVGVELGRDEAIDLYLARWQDGLQPHPMVDPLSIVGAWTDARRTRLAGREPLSAVLEGRLWGSATHPLFDVEAYLLEVPESREHPDGPTGHYLAAGRRPGSRLMAWLPDGVELAEWLVSSLHASPVQRASDARPGSGPETATAPPVTAVVPSGSDLGGMIRNARQAASAGLTVLVDSAGASPEVRAGLAALPLMDPSITVADHPQVTTAWTLDLRGVRRLPSGTTWWAEMMAAGADAVAPLLVTESGEIVTAGRAVEEGGGSVPFLRGFAGDEARGLTDVPFLALDRRSLLSRTGTEPDHPVARRLVPTVRVVVWPTSSDDDLGAPGPDEVRLWAALDFEVGGAGSGGRRSVAWTPGRARVEGRPLRWAIKNPAVNGEAGDVWGDTHFADSLAAALRRRGHHVVVDRRGAFERATADLDDVAVLIRGRKPWAPPRTGGAHAHLMWVISHPDEVTRDELEGFQRVFAASALWAAERTIAWGRPIETLLQATDPTRFDVPASDVDDGTALFVGNTRGQYRRIVRDAREAHLPLRVIGGGWEAYLPPESIAGTFVANDRLAALYAGARVVLNDHWEDMRLQGFVSNRLFDAVASGARVITDDVAGLDDLFGRSVQVYRSVAELEVLAGSADLDAIFGGADERHEVALRVREQHSFDARAATLEAAVRGLVR